MSEENKFDLKEIQDNENKILTNVICNQNLFVKNSEEKLSLIFQELNSLSLVTSHEVEVLEKAHAFILSTYTSVPMYRTYIEKCIGVLTNARFPTPDAKYWQCKKEAEVQFYELVKEVCNHKKILIDMKELIYKKEKIKEYLKKKEAFSNNQENYFNSSEKLHEKDEFLLKCEIEKIDVALMELNLLLKKTEKDIKYRIAEIEDWLEISEEWKTESKYSTESYTPHQLESVIGWLNYQIEEAKIKNDKEALNVLTDQMDTLKSLLKRKFEQITQQTKK
ncbi:MAG: hypothetical protein NZZ41_04890 [Candidatus Dojkabacteria bacterium]|nr:hypothetical protein [Candidatus Dojkabacteria bacterium]